MSIVAEELDIPVEGGALRVLRFGAGPSVAVAVHGIAGSGMAWRAVARALPDGWTLLAPDLRGRGGSAGLPGPYGLRRHAADVLRVIEHAGPGVAVLAGHSFGAYVAVVAAETRPDLVRRLLLLDGGLPMPVPDGADVDQMVAAILGPTMSRIQRTFASEAAYLDFWRGHPALTAAWDADVEDYVRYDIAGPPGELRTGVSEDAVREDGRDLLTGGLAQEKALHGLDPPALLLTAPYGLQGQPPGLLRGPMLEHWHGQLPHLRTETVPDANHYTIVLRPDAAAVVAERIADPDSWPEPDGDA
jgi:pimeloyl-ACP methyl ester carboxylesterase